MKVETAEVLRNGERKVALLCPKCREQLGRGYLSDARLVRIQCDRCRADLTLSVPDGLAWML